MITFKAKGNFNKTLDWLNSIKDGSYADILDKYGMIGVEALADATPKDTGLTASSWGYKVTKTNTGAKITFTNSNIQDGVPIAVILQYGHATNGGGWVEGIDYINPAIRPIFEDIANNAWKEVTR